MAFIAASRVLETFATTGTGTVTLAGAVAGYRTFASAMSNSDTCFYFMEGGSDWEIGYGTYSASTLARTTVLKSSNSNNAVNWAAGTKTVGIAPLGPSDLNAVNIGRLLTSMSALPIVRKGCLISNNASDATNDIDISAGTYIDGTSALLITLGSSLTKRLDAAWAVGSGNGGLDTGSIANTTYHVWLILRSDTGVVDALFSTSASSPTMPSNYDYKAYLGPIVRSGGAIRAFKQDPTYPDRFKWVTAIADRNSTSALAIGALTVSVPAGIQVEPIFEIQQTSSAGEAAALLQNADSATPSSRVAQSGATTGGSAGTADYIDGGFVTNTSAQIRYAVSIFSGTLTVGLLNTHGFYHRLGRLP